jgi:pumilio RNA-binding family
LEHLPDEYTRSLLEAIHHCTVELMQDQYGNYVIQFILEQGSDEDKAVVVSQIQGNLVDLAHHNREVLVNEIMATPPPNAESPILTMAKDQYANYVLQRALTVVDGEQKDLLFNNVRPMLAVLRHSTTTYYRPLVSMERSMDRYFGKQFVAGRVPLDSNHLLN